jgi:nucleoside-diphosphate-sugar epimerase
VANYLLTGAAGFIAARVAAYLLEDGHKVYGVDNLNHAYDPRMKTYRLEGLQEREGFTFQQMDISDKEAVAGLTQHGPFDAVINLAARAGVRASVEDPWIFLETNTTGALNLLELCKDHQIPKFILASTSSVYGADAPLPTPETAESKFPLQAYAASKIGAEALAHTYHHLYDIDVTVVRYFTVYGPAGRPDMVMFRFAKWIMEGQPLLLNGDGTQTRGFTYLDDIARGTILALKPVGYEIINLGGHEVISINDLIAMMEEIIGEKATVEHREFHKADMMTNHADVSKAGRLLGWEPQVGLQEGVKKMIEWYQDNRAWAKDIDTGV